jgi:hypothetical protein
MSLDGCAGDWAVGDAVFGGTALVDAGSTGASLRSHALSQIASAAGGINSLDPENPSSFSPHRYPWMRESS